MTRRRLGRAFTLALVAGTGALATSGAGAATTTTTDPALALQRDFVRVVRSVRPSVVEITTPSGLGSGVIYDSKGDIVTNAHVVGSATSFVVTLADGQSLPGHLVGEFVPDDLAVIKVSTTKKLIPARFGTSAPLEVGDIVLAIGSPLGLSSSVTEGIVSFNGRTLNEGNGVLLTGLVQTSAAINPGNSGGALADLNGIVVGIPTLAASTGTSTAAGLGFAIPSSTVRLIAPQLVAHGKVTTAGRAGLGVSGSDAIDFTGAPIGVVVTAVQRLGPAAKAGIVAGDLITSVDGKATPDDTTLETILARHKPGDHVKVTVVRPDGSSKTVTVVLSDLAQ